MRAEVKYLMSHVMAPNHPKAQHQEQFIVPDWYLKRASCFLPTQARHEGTLHGNILLYPVLRHRVVDVIK